MKKVKIFLVFIACAIMLMPHRAYADANADLINAIKSKNININAVEQALNRGADPNTREKILNYPVLLEAVRKDSIDIVKLLLARGADANIKTEYGMTPVGLAAARGYTDIMELLLEHGADIHRALNSAVQDGSADTVKRLLPRVNADINTLLFNAAFEGNADTMQVLLEHGGDVVIAFHLAASMAHTDIVKLLLEKGVNVDIKDKYGITALMVAAEKGKPDIVKLLLEQGADVNAKDKNGHTVQWRVSQKQSSRMGRERRNEALKLIKEYAKKGSSAQKKSNNSTDTTLIRAVRENDLEMIKILVENGVDVNERNKNGDTALAIAAKNKYSKIVKFLIQNGAK